MLISDYTLELPDKNILEKRLREITNIALDNQT